MTYQDIEPEALADALSSGYTNVLALSDWVEVAHPALPWAFDWIFGELLCSRHPRDMSVRAAVTAYWHYACEAQLGPYVRWHSGMLWYARDDRRGGERMSSQVAYLNDGKNFLISILYQNKKNQKPKDAYKTKILTKKLESPEANRLMLGYLEAWESCGERLPQLIADGQCPVELPEVTLL